MNDISKAIEKIEKGTYGVCEKCGKEISQKRLEAFPAAKLCIKCKKKWNFISFRFTLNEIRPIIIKQGSKQGDKYIVVRSSRPTSWINKVPYLPKFVSMLPKWPRWARILAVTIVVGIIVVVIIFVRSVICI